MARRTALAAAAALVLVGCGSGSGTSAGSGGASASPGAGSGSSPGTVKVLAAGSLTTLMRDVRPAFHQATGGTLEVESEGSTALAHQISGKVKQADVFISASTKANSILLGQKNGDWESWYASFARSPLLIAYNPKSKFARDLKTKPWQKVITEPGFRMGATDPKLDPKGKLARQALQKVGLSESAVQIFPEEQLLARLSSGNLDAGFFYSTEAADAHLPTVPLNNVHLGAQYTVSVLNRAPNPKGAAAFVKFFLSPQGQALLRKHGVELQPVRVTGNKQAVPDSLRQPLHTGQG